MNKMKLVIIVIFVLIVTGCGNTFRHDDKVYYENILCLPGDQEVIDIYQAEDIDISEIPKCSDFKIVNEEYEGVWSALFIRPLAWLLINIGESVGSFGFGIILVTLLLRIIMAPVTARTAQQSENMKSAKGDLENLEKKYKDRQEREDLIKKNQEQLLIYKKHNIKPLAGCVFAFIQIPLFIAFFQSINRVPVLFEENFLGIFLLGRSPLEALGRGEYHYLIFIILIIVSTHFSFKLNQANPSVGEQGIQMEKIMKFMIVFISFISFTLSVGIGLYWIFNSSFTILQNMIIKKMRERKVLKSA